MEASVRTPPFLEELLYEHVLIGYLAISENVSMEMLNTENSATFNSSGVYK